MTEPNHGLIIASEDLLAHELLAYAWLQWNREFATPPNALASANGQMRSAYRAGDVYRHPAVANLMARRGLTAPNFAWEQVNAGPDQAVVEFLKGQMKI